MLALWVRAMGIEIHDKLPKKVFGVAFTFSFIILILTLGMYWLTHTPNIVAVMAAAIVTFANPLAALFVWSEKLREKTAVYAALLVLIIIASIGVIIYEIHTLFSEQFMSRIVNSGYAVLGLLILLILGYVANQFVEKLTPSIYWRAGRFIGEDYINVVYVSAFAMIGPAIAFFGVASLDPYLGLLTLLLALMPIPSKIRNLRAYLRRRDIAEAIKRMINSWLLRIPPIKEVPEIKVYPSGPVAFAEFSVVTSELVREKLEALGESTRIPILDMVGTLVGLHAQLDTTEKITISAGLPVEDSAVVSKLTNKYMIVKIDLGDLKVVGAEEIIVEGEEESQILEGLVSKKIDVLCMKDFDKKLVNYLDGWFIVPLKIDSTSIEDAQKEIVTRIEELIKKS